MTSKSQEVNVLFEKWILDADTKLDREELFSNVKSYLESTHPEICGKCIPCRDGVVKLESLFEQYIQGEATLKTLKEIERIVYNLRASRCSVGLDIGKNMEVVLENSYNILYNPVKKY
ncbi:NADH-ubiquinone oxidoreductase-F iron-sulfur binding region [Candidatus Izimaplasma bacterium HR1]|jgi:NADH:ubiquinone oxidoreductase subunit F (NADH-binding)|uniref:NADH-ubiquinone oxidoreductase-F iron-sulfur binding region domain-containing protein n=1 Tax=Candidatus Izimoplasma sp. HR1 TaxID=1541959 RepID=UPI0004F92EFE|nr:NADH-ubiquinone oxidoreductase-F iron-sulfur binding region [Candidatus Izimaplasma bacterium HR1]